MEWFTEWIRFQLAEGQTLDNYGVVWSYDHVRPRSTFDLADPSQEAECDHWTNLRPMSLSGNSTKGPTRDTKTEEEHAMLVYIFELIQGIGDERGNNPQD